MEKENKLVKWDRSENFQSNGERYNNNAKKKNESGQDWLSSR